MAIAIGFTAGAVTAYLPGQVRNMGVRLIEIMLAFPGLLIAIMLVAVVGSSAEGAVLAIGIAFSPSLARVAYTLAAGVAGLDYIVSGTIWSRGRSSSARTLFTAAHERESGTVHKITFSEKLDVDTLVKLADILDNRLDIGALNRTGVQCPAEERDIVIKVLNERGIQYRDGERA